MLLETSNRPKMAVPTNRCTLFPDQISLLNAWPVSSVVFVVIIELEMYLQHAPVFQSTEDPRRKVITTGVQFSKPPIGLEVYDNENCAVVSVTDGVEL